MKNQFTKAAMAIIACAVNFGAFAQSNLGEDCGCPPVASRTQVLMSTLAVAGGATDGDLSAISTILTCDKLYILDKKIYVPDGKTLNIQPGTCIKGRATGDPLNANALIVSRGGKVFAVGNESCPIVFTAEADPMDGSYAFSNKGKWGGIAILGKAKNNLVAPGNVGAGRYAVSTGVGFVEGYLSAEARNLYGADPGQEDDNDNSGILKYVSIRHAGATVGAANELNGLTCSSVGRGTTLEHIEVISNDDDGIEFFGGTVNLKYATVLFQNDDAFDYDLGWNGKAQFLFALKIDAATFSGGDSGFECDGDDNKVNPSYFSHPIIYNATIIGNGSNVTPTGGGSGPWALNMKERTEGEIYSSVFVNYRSGMNLIKSLGSRPGTIESYHNWIGLDNTGATIPQTLKLQCNTFVGNTDALTVGGSAANLVAGDATKFAADGNIVSPTLPGFDFSWTYSGTTVTDQYDAVPNPALATTCIAPGDGFFTPVNYRGAFAASGPSWLSNWSYQVIIDATSGLIPCPTDINGDGTTNTTDFLNLVSRFGQACD
jgi:hypothetical protein